MSTKTVRRVMLVLTFLCLAFLGVLCAAQISADSDLLVVRTISTACALPESQFLVTLHVEAGRDLTGVGIEETLPYGWKIHPLENDGAAFKESQAQWTFSGKIKAGSKIDICYEVTVPPAEKLYSDTLPECFSISGIFQSKVPVLETAVTGDSEVEVMSALPAMSAIAHLVPASEKRPLDTVDLRLGQKITREQFTRAIELWRTDGTIPDTGGETIDLPTMEKIISYYETCTPVDEELPLANEYGLQVVRTITTFLPSDTILLPNGCLDPGIAARRFAVSVEVTAERDAYGAGLKEWFPAGWHVTPLDNDGFTYRASHMEWIYPERLAAGEKRTIVYQVVAAPTSPDGSDCTVGCCGEDARIVGTISSDLDCGEQDVRGEDTVHIWQCLPVILAISRWDTADDSLDVKLSDNISFPQVQRAVAFWQQSAAVPYTCGYTVGYETLKTIVAHWLTGTPVTELIAGAELATTPTSASPGSYDWFCQMKDEQGSDERVKGATSPLGVDAGTDRQLTCSVPVVTLSASVSGGVPPYTFVWKNSDGDKVGTDRELRVNKPGTYVVEVNSAGCCAGSDSVTVTQDVFPPMVDAGPDQVLTCAVTSVTLDGSASRGTPPYTYSWVNSSGKCVGTTEDISVDKPGPYTITVTGANGCSVSDTVKVTQDIVPPMVDAGPDQVLTCAVTSVTLDATARGGTPPYTYNWVDASGACVGNTEDITVSEHGTYTLTVTGANGCSANDSVVVNQDIVPPTVSAGPDQLLTCAVTSVTLDGSASGGTPPYTYSWMNSSGACVGNTEDIIVEMPDTYKLTVTGGNGCSASDSVTITQDTIPPTVDAGSDQTITCAKTTAKLDATVSSGRPPYTYEWRASSGDLVGCTEDIIVDQPGVYTLTAMGLNGCRASDSVAVNEDVTPPSIDIAASASTLTCLVDTIMLNAVVSNGREAYEYVWRNSKGDELGCTDGIDVHVPDTYTLTVTGANGCSANASITITQDIVPPRVSAGPDRVLNCAVTSVTLDGAASAGTPPYTYAWTDASGNVIGLAEDITVGQPGTYALTVTGANGCSASDTVTVTQDMVSPTVDAGLDQVLTCCVTSVTLDGSASSGTPPYTYLWTDSAGSVIGLSEDIDVGQPGTYVLTVAGANGCSASDSVAVKQDIAVPVVAIVNPQPLSCVVTSVTLAGSVSRGTPPYTYAWSDSDDNIVGATEDVDVSQPGKYTLTVTGANGCLASACVTVNQDIEPPLVNAGLDRGLTCIVDELTLYISVSGGERPYLFLWRDEQGTILSTEQTLVVQSPGIYRVTVVGANGCCASDEVVVSENTTPPVVDAGPDRTITCANSEVHIDAIISGGQEPYVIEWLNDCGDTVATTEDITVTLPGVYRIVVTGANGCAASDTVTVANGIVPPQVDAGADKVLTCETEEVLLKATVSGGACPYTYRWTNSCGAVFGTTEDISVSLPSVYTLTVTSADGCVGSDSVEVTQEE